MASVPLPPWSDLPPELLGLVAAALPNLSDRARFHAVCRSWNSAPDQQPPWILPLRRYWNSAPAPDRPPENLPELVARLKEAWRCWRSVPFPRQQPRIVHPDGFFIKRGSPQATSSFPENVRCIGSTDCWLALDCTDDKKRHAYFLHNPFSTETVSLPELDAIIGNVSDKFEVRKVLMRSTPEDLVAVMTNNWNHPLILIRPGKGVWLPNPQTRPFIRISDILFVGDSLYGISQREDLFSLQIAFARHGKPIVSKIEHVIQSGRGVDEAAAMGDTEEEVDYKNECEDSGNDQNYDYDGDGKIWEDIEIGQFPLPHEPDHEVVIIRYFVESHGKLLMVKRSVSHVKFTCKVEVFEADVSAGNWVLMSAGLGGQALFMSKRFCKSVPICEGTKGDAIYFIDTGEVFNMESQRIIRQSWFTDYFLPTWLFPPN